MTDWSKEIEGWWMGEEWGGEREGKEENRMKKGGKIWGKWE